MNNALWRNAPKRKGMGEGCVIIIASHEITGIVGACEGSEHTPLKLSRRGLAGPLPPANKRIDFSSRWFYIERNAGLY